MNLVDVVRLSLKNCHFPLQVLLKYATKKNFVGRPIRGYKTSQLGLMTPQAAENLCKVQNWLAQHHHYGLRIYDAYRPKRAVEDFLSWSKQPPTNAYELERKLKHYPHIQKSALFELGYVCEDSGHCYGNTVDVFLIDLKSGKKKNMGACYDYMDEASHLAVPAKNIGEEAYKNRQILLEAMQKYAFEPYEKEFWHFSHKGKSGREILDPLDIEISLEMKEIA